MPKTPAKPVVFPGSVLCTEEEFESGQNTAALASGDVVSVATGIAELDEDSRVAKVNAAGAGVLPMQKGASVVGTVALVKDNVAVIQLESCQKDGVACALSSLTAAVPVSQIERGFAKTAKDYFKAGDWVVAQVSSVSSYGVDLQTQAPELGVVKAYCDKCRKPVSLNGVELKCVSCGFLLHRKVSTEYWLK